MEAMKDALREHLRTAFRAAAAAAAPGPSQAPAQPAPGGKRPRGAAAGEGAENFPPGAGAEAPGKRPRGPAAPAPAGGVAEASAPARADEAGRYVIDAAEEPVVRVRLVGGAEAGADEGAWFAPAFVHQIFGPEELVRGYAGLRVDISLHRLSCHALVEIAYAEKQPGADDIPALLRDALGLVFTEDRREFAALTAGWSPPSGTQLTDALGAGTRVATGATAAGRCDLWRLVPGRADAGTEAQRQAVLAWHNRMQHLALLFIDGARFIDAADPRWELLVCTCTAPDGSTSLAGYATCFAFYQFPCSVRFRLSQLLVLPPFQRQGLGSMVLTAFRERAVELDARDSGVEDPTAALQRLRELLDAKAVAADGAFAAAAAAAVAAAARVRGEQDPRALGPGAALADRARRVHKLNPLQFAKVWEWVLAFEVERFKASGSPKALERAAAEHGLETLVKGRIGARFEDKKTPVKCMHELQGRDFFLWRRSNAHQSNIQIEMELDEAAEEKREELMLDLVDQRLAELAEGARNPKV